MQDPQPNMQKVDLRCTSKVGCLACGGIPKTKPRCRVQRNPSKPSSMNPGLPHQGECLRATSATTSVKVKHNRMLRFSLPAHGKTKSVRPKSELRVKRRFWFWIQRLDFLFISTRPTRWQIFVQFYRCLGAKSFAGGKR